MKHKSVYVDKICPEHDRTSCNDNNLYNAAYSIDDHDGHGRCRRCTLLAAADSGETGTQHLSEQSDDN